MGFFSSLLVYYFEMMSNLVECRGGITVIWEDMKHNVWTNNAPVVEKSEDKKCPNLHKFAPFYEHILSISPTKMKERWTNKALKMPWGSMYATVMPLWRSNKRHLAGASCGHKGRHWPESKFYHHHCVITLKHSCYCYFILKHTVFFAE